MDNCKGTLGGLRIVLLGKNVSENRHVGKFLLGKQAFDNECSPGQVQKEKRNHKTVVSCPYLLQPHLSDRKITETLKECMSLCDPGPHVIILVLKHNECSREDQEHVEKILNSFSDSVYEHTLVLTTHDSHNEEKTEVNNNIQLIIKKCLNKHYRLERNSSPADLKECLEKIAQTNIGRYLICEELKDSGNSIDVIINLSDKKENISTVVLFGNSTSVEFGQNNILLGEEKPLLKNVEFSRIVPVKIQISERHVSVLNMIDFNELPIEFVNRLIGQLVNKNEISAFIYVVQLGQLKDTDKMSLEWLQTVFGEGVLQFVMTVFTYDKEEESNTIIDDLKKNPFVEELLKKCGDRYHTCSNVMNNQSEMRELMNKVDHLVNENKGQCYPKQIYEIQLKRQSNFQKNENESDKIAFKKKSMQNTTSRAMIPKPKERVENDSSEHNILEQHKAKKIYGKVEDLFHRLNLKDRQQNKLKAADVLQITTYSLQSQESCVEGELVRNYLQKLLSMNYRARNIKTKETKKQQTDKDMEKNKSKSDPIHPMDVQMAVFYCADSFLRQIMVTKLSQCQFSLPLLVPDPFTQQIHLPLWTFRKINKSWMIKKTDNDIGSKVQSVCKAETPMVFFFRFGLVSTSKSHLINSLINEKHHTFFHRNSPGSSRTRLLMDGVVEIAWFCPSGKSTDAFTDCVAFCNLHGDAGDNEKQLKVLTEMSSVNVVLLSKLDKSDKNKTKLQHLHSDSKPLICLFTEDDSEVTMASTGKYQIGLKDRNQADVSEELTKAINDCFLLSKSMFRLENVSKHSDIRVDEEDHEDCRRGREAAQQMMSLLENKPLTEIKESFLPCQGNLWHLWCKKNKELHQPQAYETEQEISAKQWYLKGIREKQYTTKINTFMQLFIQKMSLPGESKMYFLKWLGIFMNECVLKHIRDESDPTREFQAAAFGLEHIMREVGQIYESCSSLKKNKTDLPFSFSSLPTLAAEMMMSGFPLELMDGDAVHVPLIWITAVLDELVQKLGDQRIFVLSVLGIQSSGKSTMLNAMFGLEFAVSAGRCTIGAFMQLIRVSEEMKDQLKCDYILVVDTEGLRALELDVKSKRNRDNELATFVVGLGHLTLINISGENPCDMQDILQIVVQAFLRMKKIKLGPSCMFIHQNVSEVTAEERNRLGKQRLLKTLDEMTKLAAQDEVCDAECFSDVIHFDVERGRKYFANLWEGNPPMAPPNPNYCENIQELKESIFSQASKSDGMVLTHLRKRIEDLWEALLGERFVFSFRNSLEISVYRRLETEYSKWSWTLRSAMREIKNKLHNQIENETIHVIEERHLQRELKEKFEGVKKSWSDFFERDADANILIQWKESFKIKIDDIHENILRESRRNLNVILQQRDLKKEIDAQRTHHENTLLEKSKQLALNLKGKTTNEETLKKDFDSFWEDCVKKISTDSPPIKDIDILRDVKMLLNDIYVGCLPVDQEGYNIFNVPSYSEYVIFKKEFKDAVKDSAQALSSTDEAQIKAFITDVAEQTDKMIQSFNISKIGYNISYIQQFTDYIKKRRTDHQEGPVKYVFKNEFFINLVYFIGKRVNKMITDQHTKFREANDPFLYLEKKREEYYSIFQKYCEGATSAAIFGKIICQKLKKPIEQSVYKKTSKDLTDEIMKNCESLNENRSKLEKHILKRLAEDENLGKYMRYINSPKEYFKSFIRDEVNQYIGEKFNLSVQSKITQNIEILQKKILTAAQESTEHVQGNSGDVDLWLKFFTQKLSDVLMFSVKDFSGVKHDSVDVKLLDVIKKELPLVMDDISKELSTKTFPTNLDHKDRPDEILIDHFCQCCWVQCPFCKATCTNTIENHDGDHSVPFHRNIGLSGIHYLNTTNLSTHICTSAVANRNLYFYPADSDDKVPWIEYRKSGGVYADWNITSDLSELPYWKWFVCRFQKDLEKLHEKSFGGQGKIPDEWRKYTKQEAIESLDKYI